MTQPIGTWPAETGSAEQDHSVGVVWPGPYNTHELEEVARFIPERVKMHVVGTGLESDGRVDVTLDHVLAMAEPPSIEEAAKRLVPLGVEALAYACTSASFARGLGGDRDIIDRMERVTGLPATTTSTAMLSALRRFEVSRVAVLAPYVREINEKLTAFLEDSGFPVVRMVGLNRLRDIELIPPETTVDTVVNEVDSPDADGVFISCTDMMTASIVAEMERAIGKPVITANQATIWELLRLAGASQSMPKLGRLFAG